MGHIMKDRARPIMIIESIMLIICKPGTGPSSGVKDPRAHYTSLQRTSSVNT